MKGSLTEKHRKISAVYSCDDGEHASVELNRVEKPAKGRVKPELDEIDRIDENIRKGIEELKAK